MSSSIPVDMAEADRRQFQVLVTWDSWEGWEAFCAEHNITITALVEVIGRRLPLAESSDVLADIVAEAKALTQERFRRRRRPLSDGTDE